MEEISLTSPLPTILFPESHDPRVVEAMSILSDAGICYSRTLDDFEDQTINEILAQSYVKRLAHKGITIEMARIKMGEALYRSAALLSGGYVDACIAGSMSTTADVVRAGIQALGMQEGVETVSSFFLIEHDYGQSKRVMAFADCAVVPDPSVSQLADIAISTADNYHKLTGQLPHIAMLSHSTLGSAKGEQVNKVKMATEMVRSRRPDLSVDGEMQFDAAFDNVVASIKAPDSPVAGRANVYIFPDIQSGNIAYKIAQRMGGATATGPILQGLAKPYMDLSRGCSAADIVNVANVAIAMCKSR